MASTVDQPAGTAGHDGRKVVNRFIAALEQRQADALPALLTENVVQVTAFSPQGGLGPFERYDGRDAVVDHFADVFGTFATIKLDRTGLFVSEEGTTLFVEALGDHTMAGSGIIYRNRYVFKFVLRDGRVAELIEYFNPVNFAQLSGRSGADDQIQRS